MTKSPLRLGIVVAAICGGLLHAALDAAEPASRPEGPGWSAENLRRIDEIIQRHIDAGAFTGVVTLVAHRGRMAHFAAQGLMDLESKKPMQKDAIFRVMSMTKPVIAAALLILAEEGRLSIADPVSKYIPEFKSLVVEEQGRTVPAQREMTLRDLLTHTAGFVTSQARELEARKTGRPGDTLAVRVPRLASLPLDFQPGTRWAYSPTFGFDVLARVVEIASGQAVDACLRQRIFDPLGMKDTSFAPPDGNPRVASLYMPTPSGPRKIPSPPLMNGVYFSGSLGLTSTAEDYLRFAQMLLDGGQSEGRRILAVKSVEAMSSVQVPDTVPGIARGEGFGLGVQVVRDAKQSGSPLADGTYGWPGAFGTFFWVDARSRVVAVFMGQMINLNPRQVRPVRPEFERAVRDAIVQ